MTHYTRTLIGLAAVLLLSAPVRAHVNILLDNTPQVNLSARRGQTIPFAIEVPENVDRLTIESFGGQGDGDLYLRRGAVPTTEVYDFRSRNRRNDEAFRIEKPAAGWWYAVLVAHRDFSGVSVRARFEVRDRRQDTCLAHNGGNQIVRELSGRRGSETYIDIDVPVGAETLRIATIGGRGDCDLYLSRGRRGEPKDYPHRSVSQDTVERIEIHRPSAGTWRLLVHGYGPFEAVALRVDFGSSVCTCDRGRRDEPIVIRRPLPLPRGILTAPRAGTLWRIGEIESITWRTGPRVRNVRVELSYDDGRSWTLIGLPSSIDASRGRLPGPLLRAAHRRLHRQLQLPHEPRTRASGRGGVVPALPPDRRDPWGGVRCRDANARSS